MSLRSSHCTARIAAVALFLLGSKKPAFAGDQGFRVPFGLAWNMPGLDLEMALVGANGEVVTRKKEAGDREIWFVEGLPQLALQRAKFHLYKDRLFGIELEYGKADWTAANYDGFMKSVRQGLEEKHGQGTQIARRKESEHGILQTLLGFRWNVTGGSIELVYFAAQNPTNLFRTISLHYSGELPEKSPDDAAAE